MKNKTLKLLILLGLAGCNQITNKETGGPVLTDKEVFTLYSTADSLVRIARVLTIDSQSFNLHLYEINIARPEIARQQFISAEALTLQQLEGKKTALQNTYNWVPSKESDVLFVQLQAKGFKDVAQLLDKRQAIEGKLSHALENKSLGAWLAGDLGPGGGNMLFRVQHLNQALQTTVQVLRQNNLDQNVVIGRRVLVANGDWFYEVIYPATYSGDFITM